MIDVPCFDGCVGGHTLEGDWQQRVSKHVPSPKYIVCELFCVT